MLDGPQTLRFEVQKPHRRLTRLLRGSARHPRQIDGRAARAAAQLEYQVRFFGIVGIHAADETQALPPCVVERQTARACSEVHFFLTRLFVHVRMLWPFREQLEHVFFTVFCFVFLGMGGTYFKNGLPSREARHTMSMIRHT